MMGWNSGGGMGSLGWLGMGVFWLILPDSGGSNSLSRDRGDSALDILDRRLANGQLDLPSWQAQRAALLGVQNVKQ